jgi:hypothetical protein
MNEKKKYYYIMNEKKYYYIMNEKKNIMNKKKKN